jgi:hypothetical protein
MELESLKKVRELVIDIVDTSNIPTEDKVELLLNLYHFLDPEKYEKNILTLKGSE